MKQVLTTENFGITNLDTQAMQSTDGGSVIGEAIGQVFGYIFVGLREFSRGAAESADEMPGLK